MFNRSHAEEPWCDDEGKSEFTFPGSDFPSPIAWHEAAHCIVARFYGLPVTGVTVVPSAHYGGRIWKPQADPDVSPAVQIEAAEHLCAQAVAHLPRAGEDPADAAPWLLHAAVRRIASRFRRRAPGLDQWCRACPRPNDRSNLG
jgi:hypothetical protein